MQAQRNDRLSEETDRIHARSAPIQRCQELVESIKTYQEEAEACNEAESCSEVEYDTCRDHLYIRLFRSVYFRQTASFDSLGFLGEFHKAIENGHFLPCSFQVYGRMGWFT